MKFAVQDRDRPPGPDFPGIPMTASASCSTLGKLAAPRSRPVLGDGWRLGLLLGLLALAFVLSFAVGRYPIPLARVGQLLFPWWSGTGGEGAGEMETVMFSIRLPRILAALLVGAALSASGAAYQGLFRNPLVSPGILGVSAGASFGAALAILLAFNSVGLQLTAFAFGLLAVACTYGVGAVLGRRGEPVLVMILAGVIMATLFTAFVSLIKFVADPYNTLPTITYWLMGSLAAVTRDDLTVAAVPFGLGLAVLLALRWRLNVLAFGDEEARALGVNTGRLRWLVIFCATLMTATAVAISGVIGLVGLVVPHLSRLLVGPNYRMLMPVATVMGALFLLLVDDLARSLFPVEVPLGIITAIIGAPFFLYLLVHTRRGWA